MSLPSAIANSPVFQKLVEPLREAAAKGNPYSRVCSEIPDLDWVLTNIVRILQDRKSGRDYLQSLFLAGIEYSPGMFFKNLRSSRRLNFVTHLLKSLVSLIDSKRIEKDPLSKFEELDCFDVHLGDGSFFEHSCHDDKIRDSKRPVEHFFSMNARTRSMEHLAMAQIGGEKVREHDANVLKRQDKDLLRQGAKKGKKVLYVWDRACIGFEMWHKFKMSAGVYFLTRNKSNHKYSEVEQLDFDREDKVNAGVLYDQFVKPKTHDGFVRRVVYKCPVNEETFSFITNLPKSIRPGIIAHLYKIRWNIEKAFDEIKNKYNEKKAWSKSDNGKMAQAKLIAITYNLLTLMEDEMEIEGIEDEEEKKRKKQRLDDDLRQIEENGQTASTMLSQLQKSTQRTIKFIRWLRESIRELTSWSEAIKQLGRLYAAFPR